MSKLKQKGSCRDCGCTPCEVNPRCNPCCRCLPKWLCLRIVPVIGANYFCYDGIHYFMPYECDYEAYRVRLADDMASLNVCEYPLTTLFATIAVGEFLGECTYALLQLPGLGTYWTEDGQGVWHPAASTDYGAVWKDSIPDDPDGDFRVPVAVACESMSATWAVVDEDDNEFIVTTEIAPETVGNPFAKECDGCGGCRCLPTQIQVDYLSSDGKYGIAFPSFDPLIPGYEAAIEWYFPPDAVGETAPTITLTIERGEDGGCVLVPTGTEMWDDVPRSIAGGCPYPFQFFWSEDYSEQLTTIAFGCVPPERPCNECPELSMPLAWMVLMDVEDPCNDNCGSIDGKLMFPVVNDLDGSPNWCNYVNHDNFLCLLPDGEGGTVREQTDISMGVGSGGAQFQVTSPTINGVTYRKVGNPGDPCVAVHVLTREGPEEDCYGCDPDVPGGGIDCCCPWPSTITLVPIMEL